MIEKNTVIILGAGASNDFGFPLGEELKEKVINALTNTRFQKELANGHGLRPAIEFLINDFVSNLKKDRALTIDRFLAKSDDDYRKIGKVGIVKTILNCESDTEVFGKTEKWYKILYKILNSGYPDLSTFGSNKISIITFNYDRSLEHFLFEQLCGDYGNRKDEILLQLQQIPIIHINGRVNMLPWEDRDAGLPYGAGFSPKIFDVAEGLLLPICNDVITEQVRGVLKNAYCIYFLGFGYDRINLQKLDLDIIKKCEHVFGTSFKLPIAQQDTVNNIIGNRIIRYSSLSVFNFMMHSFNPNNPRNSIDKIGSELIEDMQNRL
jgi:hypothetical protein